MCCTFAITEAVILSVSRFVESSQDVIGNRIGATPLLQRSPSSGNQTRKHSAHGGMRATCSALTAAILEAPRRWRVPEKVAQTGIPSPTDVGQRGAGQMSWLGHPSRVAAPPDRASGAIPPLGSSASLDACPAAHLCAARCAAFDELAEAVVSGDVGGQCCPADCRWWCMAGIS